MAVDPSGRCVAVANYNGGSVACLPILADGRLGPPGAVIQHRGSGANPSGNKARTLTAWSSTPTAACSTCRISGLDKVLIYRLDPAHASIVPSDPPFARTAPGAGPRHLAFHPNGRFVFVINEIDSTVTALAYDPHSGALTPIHSLSTLPPGYTGFNTAAEIVVHPSGKFLYGSNRGPDDIAAFAVDAASGKLTALGHESTQGKMPRSFAVDPTGRWLLAANQMGDNIVALRIDPQSGKLSPSGQSLSISAPVCIQFLPAAQ